MSVDYIADAGRKAKGKRPYFFDDPQVERLMNITMSIAGELAVTRERLDTIERLLEKADVFNQADVDSYTPDTKEVEAERQIKQQEYVARILRILQQEREAIQEGGSSYPSGEYLDD